MKNLIKNNIIIIVLVLMVIAAIIISKKNKVHISDIVTDSVSQVQELTDGSNSNPNYIEQRFIKITNITKDAEAKSIDVSGVAKLVYFEATFPAELRDKNGSQVWQGYASAQSDWMTEDPVEFLLIIDAESIPPGTYTLVLGDGSPADPSESGRPPLSVHQEIKI